MPYSVFCIKAPDEATAIAAATAAFPDVYQGRWISTGPGWDIRCIDPLVTTPATYDAGGNQLTAPVIDPGWHATLRVAGFRADIIGAVAASGLAVAWTHTWGEFSGDTV